MQQRRLRVALGVFSLVMVTGWVGYQVVADFGALDSLYMTVITITTVGFGEVAPLDTGGKVLTVGLIVSGVGSVSYAAVAGVEFVVEGHLRDYLEKRRMDRAIGSLDGHLIVCGFGRVGRHLAATLDRDGEAFVVVDDVEDKVLESDDLGYLTVLGDATSEHVLIQAGLDRARGLVACVNSDADNVLVTLTAKGLYPTCTVIARVKADENEMKLHRAGADRVISPSTIGGRRIAQILTRPAVADFLDGIGGGAVDYTLEEVPVTETSELGGITLRDAAIRERFGCTVLALRHVDRPGLDTHPTATMTLQIGDVLVVMGSEDDVTDMRGHYTTA
jgi:voltage-gated potassium channel